MKQRCHWVPQDNDLYIEYHDKEWGVPVHDDKTHFEFLILEGAQAGLSWITVLKKRENYRKAFANFDARKVAKFTKKDVTKMMKNEGLIRNKAKLEGAITNAKLFLDVQKEFGNFDKYIWSFVGGKTIKRHPRTPKDYQATSPESDALSKDLKKRGFKFVGSTIIYAHMQATGLIDDHLATCFRAKRK
jgi:DNA-3-methyladenine glycosylase I